MSAYRNERIHAGAADAALGEVRLDVSRTLWTGGMFLMGTVGALVYFSWSAAAVGIGLTLLTLCLGHSIGMHRLFIHGSFKTHRWIGYLLVHFGVLVGLAGPFGMLRTHDLRDWAQRQPSCHPYFSHDSGWLKDAVWQLFCTIRLEKPPRIDIEPDLRNDRVYQWLERTWRWQQLPWALVLWWLGGIDWVCWGIGTRVTASTLGHWAIGYLAHNRGSREWEVEGAAVQGHNVAWVSLLTMGESWHNNHHAFPGSARLGLAPGQWDPGWWTLLAMRRAGLAWDFVTPEALPHRPELIRAEPRRRGGSSAASASAVRAPAE